MQKGIGAAPFAIVAALIVALTVGFWVTQSAHAAIGDVVLAVDDVDGGTWVDPDTDDAAEEAHGGGTAEIRGAGTGAVELEAGYAAADEDNVFRGELIAASHWVEFEAGISDSDTDATSTSDTNTLGFTISVSGEATLSATSTLTSASCAPQSGVCQFPVYGTANAGDFSVTAAPAAGTALTAGGDGDPASKHGQWVGPATGGKAITANPTEAVQNAGTFSPAVYLSGAAAGLDAAGSVGFLFQFTDDGGRVAMNTDTTSPRDDLRVSTATDAGEDVSSSRPRCPSPTAAAVGYVDIVQESSLSAGTGYASGGLSMGGLVGVGITSESGKGTVGRIMVDLGRGNVFEHAFAIAGNPDGDMSSVGAAGTPVNLGPNASHDRMVTLRDANGTPVPLPVGRTAEQITNNDTVVDGSSELLILPAVVEADAADPQITFTVGNDHEKDQPGVYKLTIQANPVTAADPDADPAVVASGPDAKSGSHAFTVAIRNLATTGTDGSGAEVVKKTTDADGNPLEAHVGTGIDSLSIAGVTNVAGDDILDAGDEVSVGPFELITITLAALGEDSLPPVNGSLITLLSGTGFAGTGDITRGTDDAGEVTVGYRAGTTSQALAFSANGASASLLVRVVAPGAEADAPATYTLATSAVSTFHHWQGGDASSSVFENVAGLVAVWKWTGAMWVGYVSNPNAPDSTKTDFALADGDTLWIVTNGAASVTLN